MELVSGERLSEAVGRISVRWDVDVSDNVACNCFANTVVCNGVVFLFELAGGYGCIEHDGHVIPEE